MRLIFVIFLFTSVALAQEKFNCADIEDYFVTHCPILRGDYNGCCLCTQVKLNKKIFYKS